MFYCAQLTKQGVCFCVASLSSECEQPNIIELDAPDERCLGKKYVNGRFYGLDAFVDGNLVTVAWRDLNGNLVDEQETVTASYGENQVEISLVRGQGSFMIEADPGVYVVQIQSVSGCSSWVEVTV